MGFSEEKVNCACLCALPQVKIAHHCVGVGGVTKGLCTATVRVTFITVT